MKKFVVCAVIAAGLMVGSANAATLFLANAADGTGSLTLGGGESGTVNIMLTTVAGEPTAVAFVNAFLDLDSAVCDTDVTAVTHGQTDPQWTYDTSAYKLPAELDDACDGDGDEINEYGLVFGSSAGPGFPTGAGTHVLDGITVTHGGSDIHDDVLYFEGGARKPQAFGPPPTYTPYTTNDFLCLEVFGLLNMGEGNYTPGCANGFDIHKTPEPAALALLAIGGLAALRRRR